MTIIAFNRYWVIRWHWVLVSLLVAACLTALSLWQLSRAAEKKQTLQRIAQSQAAGPLDAQQLLALNTKSRDAIDVQFPARWIAPMIWLLDNQQVDGRIGYDVVIAVEQIRPSEQSTQSTDHAVPSSITPTLLVNLGWVAAQGSRDQLPEVNVPAELMVNGIFRANAKGLLLGKNIEDKGQWPMRIQQIDAGLLSDYIPSLSRSGVIFQQQQSPFYVHYQPVILPPERHTAYAVQWALLAIAVIVIALSASATRELAHDKS
jgi:surfeit locus 1 family protein